MPTLETLIDYCDRILNIQGIEDYCPNGLQIEANEKVQTLVTGVTASLALIEQAIEADADLLLVHHGYFWKNEPLPLVGMKGRRIARLFRAGLSMAAYHLPLDVHPQLGNNCQLGRRLGVGNPHPLDTDGLLWGGELPNLTLDEWVLRMTALTGHKPLVFGDGPERLKTVAWCTGGGQHFVEQAIARGFDVFVTGEASEHNFHMAREGGIHFIAAGHHATERYGVMALGEALAQRFAIRHLNIDIDNPV